MTTYPPVQTEKTQYQIPLCHICPFFFGLRRIIFTEILQKEISERVKEKGEGGGGGAVMKRKEKNKNIDFY